MKKWIFVIFMSILLLFSAGCDPAKQVGKTSNTSLVTTANTTDKPVVS